MKFGFHTFSHFFLNIRKQIITCGWPHNGTGCPGQLRSLQPHWYSKAIWTQSWAGSSRWPCLSKGVGPSDLQRSLPASTILWFYDFFLQFTFHCHHSLYSINIRCLNCLIPTLLSLCLLFIACFSLLGSERIFCPWDITGEATYLKTIRSCWSIFYLYSNMGQEALQENIITMAWRYQFRCTYLHTLRNQ